MKVIEKDSGFVEVHNAPIAVVKYLRMSVSPVMRYFTEDPTPHWCVYKDHIVHAVQLGYITLGHVDYSELSNELQMIIAQEKQNWTVRKPKKSLSEQLDTKIDLHSTLFLTPDAPDFIIDAVWKALARKHHPDAGGDSEAFKRFNDAYKKIKRK